MLLTSTRFRLCSPWSSPCHALLGIVALAAALPAQSWVQLTTAGSPGQRGGSAMAFDNARGRSVLFGGVDATGVVQGDTWEWDGAVWQLRAAASAPAPRRGHAMVFDSRLRRAVLVGGLDSAGAALGDTWEWNGTNWTQRAVPGPSARAYHAMAFDAARGRTVLFGGTSGGTSFHSDTWTWDGAQWSFQGTASAPSPRRSAGLAYDPVRQQTVLFGGGSTAVFGDTWEWNGATWTQRSPVAAPAARWATQLAFDSLRNKVLLFGGADATFTTNFSPTWEWDGTTWAQVSMAASPSARHGHLMVTDAWRGTVLVYGGRDGGGLRADTWESRAYAPPSGQWQLRSRVGPSTRERGAMACDTTGSALLFGGRFTGGISPPIRFNDTWRWNGTSWQAIAGPGPSSRDGAAMAFDRARGKFVLFGGIGGSGWNGIVLGDTWLWDGTSWTAGLSGPPAGVYGMVYDSARSRIVMHGGGVTWEWDGSVWQQRIHAVGPSARERMAMAYDPVRARTVLHGGAVFSLSYPPNPPIWFPDTWEWDGTAWTLADNSGPSRMGHVMSFDAVRGRMVFYGGYQTDGGLGVSVSYEFWERFGSTWVLDPATQPLCLNCWENAMDFDVARERLVLFLGYWYSGDPHSELWEQVPNAALVGAGFPYGFGCGSPALALSVDPAAPPRLGSPAGASIQNAPVGIAFVAVGTNRSSVGNLPIPWSLAGYGMPGCDLLHTADLGVAFATTAAGANGLAFAFQIPALAGLVGFDLFLQSWAPAPSANAAGVVVSNGLVWRIGNW